MLNRALLILVALPSIGISQASQSDAILRSARDRISSQCDNWFKDGKFLPVIQAQEFVVGSIPEDEETWSNLIWMYMNIERADLQWECSRRFSEANPGYKDANYYTAEFLYLKRQYAKIPSIVEPMIEKLPHPDANCYRFLANSYDKMGYYQDSLRVWDAYLLVNPQDGQAKVNRSKVFERLKK